MRLWLNLLISLPIMFGCGCAANPSANGRSGTPSSIVGLAVSLDAENEFARLIDLFIISTEVDKNKPVVVDLDWHKHIIALGKSTEPDADKLLALIGTLKLDGALAEDFDCAIVKRGRGPANEMLKLAQNYNQQSWCEGLAKAKNIKISKLCLNSEQIIRNALYVLKNLDHSEECESE